ncbi:MAG: cytochrome b/b6 domain-containing protein [Dehalococcoidia bacterium]|nr:cytochrome b/b6 domain-containing protein [Dehalococcoidia bacterium]
MATITRTDEAEKVQVEEQVTRFDVHQIIQHAVLMVSFILLVVTGLPMKFSTAGISEWWVQIWGGISNIRAVHHTSAYVMVLVCLYHLIYIGYGMLVKKRPFPMWMVPSVADFVKLFQELAYFVGLRKEPPQFDRFNWREKFDYWAIFWGMPVMAGSGFILMFPVFATKYLPGWVVPVAYTAHSHEAMLAFTWIFFIHIFFNHFSPSVYPLNKSIFTGKVPRERYIKEHALEYERLTRVDEEKPEKEAVGTITRASQ